LQGAPGECVLAYVKYRSINSVCNGSVLLNGHNMYIKLLKDSSTGTNSTDPKKLQIILLGDSNTQGIVFGKPGTAEDNKPLTLNSYFERLKSKYPMISVKNYAVSAKTTKYLLEDEVPKIKKLSGVKNICSVLIGTNDFGLLDPKERLTVNEATVYFNKAIEKMSSKCDHIVVMTYPFRKPYYEGDPVSVNLTNAINNDLNKFNDMIKNGGILYKKSGKGNNKKLWAS